MHVIFVAFAFVWAWSVADMELYGCSSVGVLVLLPLYLTSPLSFSLKGSLLLSAPSTMHPLGKVVSCLLFVKASAWLPTSLRVGSGHEIPHLASYDSSRQPKAMRISVHQLVAKATCLSSSDTSNLASSGCSVFAGNHCWFPKSSRTGVMRERGVRWSTISALMSAAGDSGVSEDISEYHVRHTTPIHRSNFSGEVLPRWPCVVTSCQ